MAADPLLQRFGDALGARVADGPEASRAALEAIWDAASPAGDPLARCLAGHYLADLQDDPAAALVWNLRALDAVAELTDARLQAADPALTIAGFLPSLQLNVAEDYRLLGDGAAARRHLVLAEAGLPALPDDGYGRMLRQGVARLAARLDLAGQNGL